MIKLAERCLLVILLVLLAGHFSLLTIFGKVTYYENNLLILYAELGLSVALLGFVLGRYISFIRKGEY